MTASNQFSIVSKIHQFGLKPLKQQKHVSLCKHMALSNISKWGQLTRLHCRHCSSTKLFNKTTSPVRRKASWIWWRAKGRIRPSQTVLQVSQVSVPVRATRTQSCVTLMLHKEQTPSRSKIMLLKHVIYWVNSNDTPSTLAQIPQHLSHAWVPTIKRQSVRL